MKNYNYKNKLILVTGGSGFLGVPLVESLLLKGARVRIISRDEGKLIDVKSKFPTVEILTGDIADRFEVKQSMKDVNAVFHLAASKHVGIAEKQVRECIKSNTIGSLNILEQSLEQPIDFVVGISTDKAAQVAGVYGASKLLMERLFSQFEEINKNTEYRIVRYGNVLYSTGSVLCKWKQLLEENKEVVVTDGNATRFFWSIEQALELIFNCLENSVNSKPYVPFMKSIKINDLLEAMAQKYLPDGGTLKVKTIGIQPGENMHEKVLEEGPYSNECEQYTVDEIKKLI